MQSVKLTWFRVRIEIIFKGINIMIFHCSGSYFRVVREQTRPMEKFSHKTIHLWAAESCSWVRVSQDDKTGDLYVIYTTRQQEDWSDLCAVTVMGEK